MNRTDILNQIQKNVERLSASDLPEYKYIPLHQKPSPSVLSLREVMLLLRKVIFPGFFGSEQEAQVDSIQYYTGVYLEKIYDLLQEQIYNGLCFEVDRCCDSKDRASRIAIDFINKIPHIKYLLSTDVKAILKYSPICAPGWMSIPVSEWAISVMIRGRTGTLSFNSSCATR